MSEKPVKLKLFVFWSRLSIMCFWSHYVNQAGRKTSIHNAQYVCGLIKKRMRHSQYCWFSVACHAVHGYVSYSCSAQKQENIMHASWHHRVCVTDSDVWSRDVPVLGRSDGRSAACIPCHIPDRSCSAHTLSVTWVANTGAGRDKEETSQDKAAITASKYWQQQQWSGHWFPDKRALL